MWRTHKGFQGVGVKDFVQRNYFWKSVLKVCGSCSVLENHWLHASQCTSLVCMLVVLAIFRGCQTFLWWAWGISIQLPWFWNQIILDGNNLTVTALLCTGSFPAHVFLGQPAMWTGARKLQFVSLCVFCSYFHSFYLTSIYDHSIFEVCSDAKLVSLPMSSAPIVLAAGCSVHRSGSLLCFTTMEGIGAWCGRFLRVSLKMGSFLPFHVFWHFNC